MSDVGVQLGEALIEGGQPSSAGPGKLGEVGIAHLPVTDHTGQPNLGDKDAVGPELMPRLSDDDPDLVEGLIGPHPPAQEHPEQCALGDRAGRYRTFVGGHHSIAAS